MANHGLVGVAYTRRIFSLRTDTDTVIASVMSRFPDSIDDSNIGIAGESFGGREALSYGAGISFPA
jgi:predicted dienelactone hydrolase